MACSLVIAWKCMHTIPFCRFGVKQAKFGVVEIVANWRAVLIWRQQPLLCFHFCHARIKAQYLQIFFFFKRHQKSGSLCRVYHFLKYYVNQPKHICRLKWALSVASATDAQAERQENRVEPYCLHLGTSFPTLCGLGQVT